MYRLFCNNLRYQCGTKIYYSTAQQHGSECSPSTIMSCVQVNISVRMIYIEATWQHLQADFQAFMNAVHQFLLYSFYLDMPLEFSKESIILLVG